MFLYWNQTSVLLGEIYRRCKIQDKKKRFDIKLLKKTLQRINVYIGLIVGKHKSSKYLYCRGAERQEQKIKPKCTIYTFSFYSLCSEIAGSIISLITLLDMMHQNLSFTGIHWIEHKVSQWIHDWQFCPLHLQQWMTVSRYFVFLFFWLFLFLPLVTLCPSVHRLTDLHVVWQWHSILQILWRSADFCFTSTI